MAVHIFTVSEENYKICVEKGLVAIPDSEKSDVFDGLLSRLSGVKEDDYVLMYVIGAKFLRPVRLKTNR